MKKYLVPVLLLSLFGFLLFFPQQSLAASKSGLLLWYDSLVPVLLPFLILSQLFLKTPAADRICHFLKPLFCRIFHCSAEGVFCLLCGFLCGYPVGARLIVLLIKEDRLTLKEGQYLLSFCNNVSPMFCISYGITKAIGSREVLPFLLIIYGSPLLFGLLTRPRKMPVITAATKKQTSPAENIFRLIDVCIIDSFEILLKLCGYLILFSIISSAIALFLPPQQTALLPAVTAFLEVTGGLSLLSTLPFGTLRSALSIMALTFGGVCCILQTNSVIEGSGLSIEKYTAHKAATAFLSLGLFLLRLFLFGSLPVDCRG